ncbi:unnamed protein product [Arabidopsis lyrata]|uniref:SKP1 component dimerisation domain-containing protein n=1 Tax=Arabidopsis lyrata subsp. lyrata TaxID=81972 RepID=D7KBS1_ARALL|nr:uncharacterized protein LOC9329540 [Arabidopsis lyrata subsp. lyrata]EFH69738.1 hypothetical protein ARALYDRAFT_335902 [Arabidopsis lyrata subsp. lyrata]CAH8253692.1 unnamed protein product [Arabidopsis lyrata]|eukprot:XP_002893479.1 uncharacterized protein LOC9329540 [Arabidopsis lyrata subsp. lyrata]
MADEAFGGSDESAFISASGSYLDIVCNDAWDVKIDPWSMRRVSVKMSDIIDKTYEASDNESDYTVDVSSNIMRKVVTYCVKRNYQSEDDPDKPFSTEDEKWIREEFSKEKDPKKLFDLYKASVYLGFPHLRDLIRTIGMENEIFQRCLGDNTDRIRKEKENESFLATHQKILSSVVLPKLDNQSLVRFGALCKGASKVAEPLIISRGIFLNHLIPELNQYRHNHIRLETQVILVSSDGVNFPITERAALESTVLRVLIAENYEHLPTRHAPKKQQITHTVRINNKILTEVIAFCNLASTNKDEAMVWVIKSLDSSSKSTLGLIKAAQELQIDGLLDWIADEIATKLKAQTVARICQTLGLENEESEEEYEQVVGLCYNSEEEEEESEKEEDDKDEDEEEDEVSEESPKSDDSAK